MSKNPEQISFGGDYDDIQDPILASRLLGEGLDYFRSLGLDPSLASAYSPDSDQLYMYDGMSSDFTDKTTGEKLGTLTVLSDHYKEVYENGFTLGEEYDNESRRVRRMAQRSRSPSSHGSVMIQAYQSSELGRQWLEDTFATQKWGIMRSSLVRRLASVNDMHYSSTFDHSGHDHTTGHSVHHKLEIFGPFVDYAFGRVSPTPDSLTEPQLTSKLQEMGVIDLSKELLDARFEHFCSVAQLEVSVMFLADLARLKAIGGARRQALLLATKHRKDILVDDYETKVRMSQELADAFTRSALRERDPQAKRVLKALGNRSALTAQQLVSMRDNFRYVYDNLGYDLPATLQPSDNKPKQPTIVVRPTQQLFEPDANNNSEQLTNEIETQTEQLHLRAQAFSREWRLSAKQRRDAKLGQMQHELIEGFKAFTSRQLLEPMSKDEAQQISDYLYGLYLIASTGPEARSRLTESLSRQLDLEEDCQLVQIVADEANIHVNLPSIEPVSQHINIFGSEWNTFRQLILKTWPDYEGVSVVKQLEALLFNQDPDITDDSSVEEVVSLQRDIASQLDRIILPPDATIEDLARELERTGANNTAISEIEWQRLRDLIEVRDQFDGVLFRSKERSLGNAPPYFVAVINIDGDTFAIAESPVFGNATYLVSEKHAPGTWLEVLELSKTDARSVGAYKIVHPKKGKPTSVHINRIYDRILELHLTAPTS